MTTGLVHRAEFRGASRELMGYRGAEVVIAGPAGTGKTRAALTKVHLACLQTPKTRCLMVRRTAKSLSSSTVVTFREKVAQEALLTGAVAFHGGSAQDPPSYRYANGSVIVLGGMDNPDKVLSTEYDLIFVDECNQIAEKDWNTLMSRLRNGRLSFQQLIGCTNPDRPAHWILVRARATLKFLHSRHRDNPAYYTREGVLTTAGEAYMAKLDAMTGVTRLRLRDGLWAAAEGVIYDGFDPSVHVIERFEIPASWTRWWAVDFGYVHPFVCQWWAEDPDGRLYLYRELVHTKRLVEDHAKQILDQVTDEKGEWTEPRPRRILTDHAAEDRATLDKHLGMKTRPAVKTVSDGLQAVASRMKIQGDGKARLYILEDSLVERDKDLEEAGKPVCLAEEIPGYSWMDHKTKEQPVKEDDDSCDAMRYVVAQRDLGGRQRADRYF
jgi:phage terminase large subunit